MIGKTRVGLKYLFVGMVVGVFFAPRSGKETRSRLVNRVAEGAGKLFAAI